MVFDVNGSTLVMVFQVKIFNDTGEQTLKKPKILQDIKLYVIEPKSDQYFELTLIQAEITYSTNANGRSAKRAIASI